MLWSDKHYTKRAQRFRTRIKSMDEGKTDRKGATVLECFAGIGSGTIALKRLGIEIVKGKFGKKLAGNSFVFEMFLIIALLRLVDLQSLLLSMIAWLVGFTNGTTIIDTTPISPTTELSTFTLKASRRWLSIWIVLWRNTGVSLFVAELIGPLPCLRHNSQYLSSLHSH